MASLSCAFVFVLCVFAVEALPNARRSEPDKAFVLYRMPPRCVEAPPNDICDLGYKIRYMGDTKFGDIVSSSFGGIKKKYQSFGYSDECVEQAMKLFCRSAFPKCLPNQLDYGDQHGLIDQISVKCGLNFRKEDYTTGIHEDPSASFYTFNCVPLSQDPQKKCPEPKYAVPSRQVSEYYERILNVSREMAKDKKKIPPECYQKAFNIFACSYAFCSSDEKALLMKTSRDDCEEIGRCLENEAEVDKDAIKFLKETCPKYPSPDTHEEVDLPY